MITVERISAALKAAPISLEEKEAWAKLIPHLTEGELEKMVASFEQEVADLSALRSLYLSRVQTVVDRAAAGQIKSII